MRPSALVSSFFLFAAGAAAAADTDADAASTRTAAIYLEPVVAASSASSSLPSFLAEIRYDAYDLSQAAEVTSYAAPDFEDAQDEQDEQDGQDQNDDTLYRVGLYDPSARRWLSATSVTAAANFAKGYRPHIVLTMAKAASGESLPLGASVRGLVIDAGATRDFGPQATVVAAGAGKAPALNRPVVLSPEGKNVEPPEEKTFLQKYWWIIAIAVLVMTATGPAEQ